MRRAVMVLVISALTAVAAGTAAAVAVAPTASGTTTASAAASARSLFATNCGRCHTLAAAGTRGRRGPNLDRKRLTVSRVSREIRGGGFGMPSFSSRLSSRRIRAIARYVVRVSAGS